MVVVLDTGVLGFLTNPSDSAEPIECKQWLDGILSGGAEVRVPEIADYELRRELIRINSAKALARLDELGQALGYVALSTPMMRRAAEFWANARNIGLPTAPDHALDGDVILAAQVAVSAADQHPVVATTNVKHLERFVPARLWRDITASEAT
jgi:predicted nucleic acid-binding protein